MAEITSNGPLESVMETVAENQEPHISAQSSTIANASTRPPRPVGLQGGGIEGEIEETAQH